MKDTIRLYAYTFRSRAERVLWTLKELEIDVTVVRINPFKEGEVERVLQPLNPDAKVPVLVHNGEVMLESLAIMEYLNAISESKHLVPLEADSNYALRRKLHYGLTEIEPYLWLVEQANGPLSQHYHWPTGVYEESIHRVEQSCKAVKEFIVNEQHMLEQGFSMADIYYYHVLTWAKQHGIEHDSIIENYLLHLEQRDAFPAEMYWKD